jgi:hypothetical protein
MLTNIGYAKAEEIEYLFDPKLDLIKHINVIL